MAVFRLRKWTVESVLRALPSVREHDEALMTGLIVMHLLGDTKRRNFGKLMAEAGDMDVWGTP